MSSPPIKEAKPGKAAAEITSLTKVQKLAALLVMLGTDSAAQVLKSFEPEAMELITAEMTKLTLISQELQRDLLAEFSEVALQAGTSVQGGLDFTRQSLEKALGVFRATDIINRVAPSRGSLVAMQSISDMESRQIFNLLRHEQPQTVALVLSFIQPDKAAAVFTLIPVDQRERVLERLATLAPTPIEVVEKVVSILNAKLGVRQTRALNQSGGTKTAADILNSMEKATGKSLLLSIEEHNPDLCQAIREKMFTFEDLATLELQTLQNILREVDMRDLAMALKTASDKLKTTLLSCISKRAAEAVQEEITFMGPVRLRDIESAQLRVIDAVRKLENEGNIELGKGRQNNLHEMV
jgi:flagellar motor switch protein FliG